jgi:hydrogenase maturation protease
MPMDDETPRFDVVLGVGNPLMGDDGLGIAVVAHVQSAWGEAPGLLIVDGGTWGMNLLPIVEEARRLLIVDAIDRDAKPGTLVTLQRDEIPRYFGRTLSPHQLDLREVLALAELRGTLPEDTVAVGIQPAAIELSLELSSEVVAALPALLDDIESRLRRWGYVVHAEAVEHA